MYLGHGIIIMYLVFRNCLIIIMYLVLRNCLIIIMYLVFRNCLIIIMYLVFTNCLIIIMAHMINKENFLNSFNLFSEYQIIFYRMNSLIKTVIRNYTHLFILQLFD